MAVDVGRVERESHELSGVAPALLPVSCSIALDEVDSSALTAAQKALALLRAWLSNRKENIRRLQSIKVVTE